MIALRAVRPPERRKLWNIFQKYLYEMTAYYDEEMDGEGEYPYRYFDAYFEEPDREALFLWEGNALAGFAMLNRHSYLDRPVDHVLAEFTLFPMYRGQGLGLEAAQALFARYPGRWELKYHVKNAGAGALWTRAARPYGPEAAEYGGDERVLAFTVPSSPRRPAPE